MMTEQEFLLKQEELLDQIKQMYTVLFRLYSNDVVEPHFIQRHLTSNSYILPGESTPHRVLHAAQAAQEAGVREAAFLSVPSDYYDRPLLARAYAMHLAHLPLYAMHLAHLPLLRDLTSLFHRMFDSNLLKAPSTDHLCKSLIFENTRSPEGEPRYFMVIVQVCTPHEDSTHTVLDQGSTRTSRGVARCTLQYTTKLDTEVLGRFIQAQRTPRLPNKNYNMRLAQPDDSLRLTGYENNAVCPFGCNARMDVIVARPIAELKVCACR
jgi:hypothetical protein